MNSSGHREQLGRVRERFTRTAAVFSDFALAARVGEAKHLLELVSPAGEERALDLACGPGTLALAFAPRVRWICGMDFTLAMLDRAGQAASEANIGNFEMACGQAQRLPFGDRVFDLVVSSYSLHHMSEQGAVIREVARVVRRAGRFGLLDMIVPEDRDQAEANNQLERARDASHTRTLPTGEIRGLLSRAGFHIVAEEAQEHPRSFDDWMRVAGWKRGDPAYETARQLMEASLPQDGAGFHPRLLPADPSTSPDGRGDIAMTQTVLFVVAERE